MHLQPVFQGCEVTLPRPLPAREGRGVAEALFRDGLCLPSGAAMSEADLALVVEVIDTPGNVVGRGMVRSQHHVRTDRSRIRPAR